MAPQQAGMGGIIQGGYDSDVEGGNAYNDTAGFESFSDKAVSYISWGSFKKPNHVITLTCCDTLYKYITYYVLSGPPWIHSKSLWHIDVTGNSIQIHLI